MVKTKSRLQTEMATKVVVVRKSLARKGVWVRVPPWPLKRSVAQSGQRA